MSAEYPSIPESFKVYFWTLGDANKDGKIDILDAFIVSNHFNQAYADADFNGDGKVDILDAIILTKNFGKTIEAEWQKTVDKERAEAAAAAAGGAPNVPWYIDWARELAAQQAANDQAYANWLNPAMQSFMESLQSLASLPDTFWKGNISNYDEILKAQIASTHKTFLSVAQLPISTTPSQEFQDEWGVSEALGKKLLNDIGLGMGELPVERYKEVENAARNLIRMQQAIVGGKMSLAVLNQTLSSLSLNSTTLVKDAQNIASQAYGWDSLASLATMLPIQAAVIEPARQFYNSQYTPNIPGPGDLVRMLGKGKITLEGYAEMMALNGFDEYWQANFWQAHYTQPSAADALLAWRRGSITNEQLDALFEHADLDPQFKAIWQERKFDDMSVGMAQRLWDIGLIDDAKLLQVTVRNGFFVDDAARIADSVKQFPIRRVKLRGILALATGAAKGALSRDQIAGYVTKLGYDAKLVDWLVWYGDLAQTIVKAKVAKAPKEKLLSLGDLKAAYMRGLVTEDVFRTELLGRNYSLDDIQILLALMVERRTVELAGGKMYALSVIELLNAWRYEVITEDDLRNKLLARGLPLDELETLIATKKVQWQITPRTAG